MIKQDGDYPIKYLVTLDIIHSMREEPAVSRISRVGGSLVDDILMIDCIESKSNKYVRLKYKLGGRVGRH